MDATARMAARVHHLHDLGEVVSAMRSMAAGHVQQARTHLVAIHAYNATIEQALSRVANTVQTPAPASPAGNTAGAVLLLGAEHGFCGDFAERLADSLRESLQPTDRVYVVGRRSVAACEERGVEVTWQAPMVSHADGVLAVARDAVDAVYEPIASGLVQRLTVLHGEAKRGGGVAVVREMLLPFEVPVDGHGAAPAPLANLSSSLLVERLVDEFVMARVVRAGMESLAAENTARLFATSSASEAIGQHIETLQARLRIERQEAITAELAELVAGGAFETR